MIDKGFTVKKRMKLHQGMSRSLKTKLIDDYLVNYNKRLNLGDHIFHYVNFFMIYDDRRYHLIKSPKRVTHSLNTPINQVYSFPL